jgi:hypothetical protein
MDKYHPFCTTCRHAKVWDRDGNDLQCNLKLPPWIASMPTRENRNVKPDDGCSFWKEKMDICRG